MGTWGYGIYDSDSALDLLDDFDDLVDQGVANIDVANSYELGERDIDDSLVIIDFRRVVGLPVLDIYDEIFEKAYESAKQWDENGQRAEAIKQLQTLIANGSQEPIERTGLIEAMLGLSM